MRVDQRDLAGLGQALGGAADDGLVDSLLDDLVADVVGPVHVEALLVEPEADGERGVLDRIRLVMSSGTRQPVLQPLHPQRDAAGDHELPEAHILR